MATNREYPHTSADNSQSAAAEATSSTQISNDSKTTSADTTAQENVRRSKDSVASAQSAEKCEKSPPPAVESTAVVVKSEPVLMENASGLNNLLAVAAAETLNVKPTTAVTQHKSGGKGHHQSQPASNSNMPLQQPNFFFGQPQLTGSPQFFIAGPSPSTTNGMPYQQILIPINQPPMQSAMPGSQMAQQYITVPTVSLGMGSHAAPSSIQILANPPIIAAAGLQPFAIIPNQPVMSESSMMSGSHSKQSSDVSSTNNAGATPMFMSPQPHTDVSTSMGAELTNQMAKFLPSIQSLVSTSLANHCSPSSAGDMTSVADSGSPAGANETLVSSTEPGSVIDGINLDEIKEFAKQFKCRRLSMGLTQTQVGQALSVAEGPAYSQSAICRFEKLDITPKSAQKIKPVLERWLVEAEAQYHSGGNKVSGSDMSEKLKKRKRRTSFTPQAVEALTEHFLQNTHPSGSEMTMIANKLGYEREVVRVWFCNKRQALKNATKRLKPDTSVTEPTSVDEQMGT